MTTSPWILLLLPLLFTAAATDLAWREIPNWVSLCLALAFLPTSLVEQGCLQTAFGLLAGLLVFALAFIPFTLGLLGGGDVKLLATCTLWAGWAEITDFLLLTALLGGLVALATIALHVCRHFHTTGTRPACPTVPYGVAIAGSILWIALAARPGVA